MLRHYKVSSTTSGEQKFPKSMTTMTMFQADRLFHDQSRVQRQETCRREFLSLNVQAFIVDDRQSVPSADVPTHSKIFLDFETV